MAGLGFDITANNQQLRDSLKESEKDALSFEKTMEKVGESIDKAFDNTAAIDELSDKTKKMAEIAEMSFDEAISKSREYQNQIEQQKKTLTQLIEAQTEAYNTYENASFLINNPSLNAKESAENQITPEKYEEAKAQFESITNSVKAQQSELSVLKENYEATLNVIASKSQVTAENVGKSMSKMLAPDAVKISIQDIMKSLSDLNTQFSGLKQKTGVISENDIQAQKAYLSELDRIYKSVVAISDYTKNGVAQSKDLAKQYEVSRNILGEVKKEMKEVSASIENGAKAAQKQATILSQMRTIREEMAQLRGSDGIIAPENVKRYEELKGKLAEVGTAYRLVQKEQKYLTTEGSATLAGVLQGITGLAGGFTAAQGVISLFVKDNEKLAAIQTKLQAAMSITIGLQQVSNALSTTSAFKTQIVTKVTDLWQKAQVSLNTQLGITAGLTKALAAGGLAALAVGLIYVVTQYKKWSKEQQALTAAQKAYMDSITNEIVQVNKLFNDLSKLTKGSKEYNAVKKQINDQYGDILANQRSEIKNLTDEAAAHRLVAKAVLEKAKAKGRENEISKASEDFSKNWNNALDGVFNEFASKFGKEKGAELFRQFSQGLMDSGGKITKELEGIYRQFDKITTISGGNTGQTFSYKDNSLALAIGNAATAYDDFNRRIEYTDMIFGNIDTQTKSYIGLLEKQEEKLEKLKEKYGDISKIKDEKILVQYNKEKKAIDDETARLTNLGIESLKTSKAIDTALEKASKSDFGIREKSNNITRQSQQEEINLMKDGSAKRIAQMKLNHAKEIDELKRNKEEYIKLLRDKAKAEFEADPKNKGKKFNSSRVGLSKAETDMFDNLEAQTLKRQGSEIAQERIKVLKDYQTYAQARLDAIRKYEDERKQLESLGASQEQLSENDRRKNKALEEIDNLFASKQESFNSWMQEISSLTLDQLTNALDQAKHALSMSQVSREGENSEKRNTEQVAILRAQMTALESQIATLRVSEKKKDSKDGNKKAIKQWKLLQDVLDDTRRSFTDLGKAIGGTAGEILSSVGEISASTTQIINHIVTFSQISSTSIEGVSKTAANAIKSVEKASVILAIISAALQIAMKIADVVGGDDTTEKYNQAKEAYESYIAILDKVIEKQLKLAESLAGDNANAAYEKALETLNSMNDAARTLGKQYLDSGASWKSRSKGYKEVEDMSDEGWRQAAEVMGMSSYKFSQLMGSRMTGLFDLTAEELANLRDKAWVFWGQLDSDTRAYADKIADSVQQILDIEMKEKEDKTLISFDAFRDSFLDTLSDMDSSSADFAENFEEYLKKAIMNSLIKKQYQDDIQALYDSFAKYNDDDLIDQDEYSKLQNQKDALVESMLKEREKLKDLFGWESLDDRSAEEQGITSMSQESADKLLGLNTVSVEHTRQILDRMGLVNVSIGEMQKSYQGLLDTCNSILNHTRNIDSSTAAMNTTMQGMNSSISNLRDDINSMKTNGIAIKK